MSLRDLATIAASLGLTVAFGAAAHHLQLATDDVRFQRSGVDERTFLPDARAVKIGVMGYDQLAADLLWVRAVLTFADIYDSGAEADARWLRTMLETVATLDPSWRTVYFYGGSMARVIGDIDTSDALYQRGVEALPDDPYFPFSLGMNAYMYRKPPDLPRAAEWLRRAAEVPGAPSWYLAAAAGFLDEHGQREAAIRYIDEQIEATSDPETRDSLARKRRSLLHDELASQLGERVEIFRDRIGQDPRSVEDLAPLPEDPLGGRWVYVPKLGVLSSVRYEEIRRRAIDVERYLLMNRVILGDE